MPDQNTFELRNSRRYNELAWLVRQVARLARSAFAPKELLRLAASFEYRADHFGRYKN